MCVYRAAHHVQILKCAQHEHMTLSVRVHPLDHGCALREL